MKLPDTKGAICLKVMECTIL